jgi:ACS family hexuronate transporter-like MFS transporter
MHHADRTKAIAPDSTFQLPGLRWWIVGLVFLATLINYIDRLTLSVLAPVITEDLGLTNTQFGGIAAWFLLAYTISQGVSGRIYDRVGTRIGFMLSITLWSLAAMAHAFARGVASLSACRFALGLGEAGNWPGAAKAIAEWFPVRQRALGMAIFNSGAALGSVVAPPLIVFLALQYGWQATFLVTGSLGFIWLAVWWLSYRAPAEHPWLTASERELIREGQPEESAASAATVPWRELLRHRPVWGIVAARFFTDPVWWLYLTWLPLYLANERGFSLKEIAMFT